ncbi:protease [Mucilaginibacter polytrichastri]|uniref:Protease n=1 Tax=Mucilaginibacter polytrichastri TaxID=1302689 RepID=A0A1Q6A2L0_9SPHI|nr:protease [Mucilaginibacter polytrichastri]OKS88243.1 hypothetical protein RG47T_3708 [Mucilaginibacter polytrichastri]SFT27384.1 hypothetical protein SAMN04487890_12812 [Mucilaginibacter polytrichastri]
MKNYKLLSFAALLALAACNVNSKTTSTNTTDSLSHNDTAKNASKALFVNMQIKDTINVGDSVLLKFTVHNPADSTQQFCKWHTPFEPLLSKYLEVKNEAGTEADYRGAMAKRIMPPPVSSYIKVNPKDSMTSNVDLLKGFAITQPGKYTITYVGQNMSGLVSEQTVSFVYLKK